MTDSSKKKRVYLFAAVLLTIIYFLAGFHSFHTKIPSEYEIYNGVVSEPDQRLHFRSPGIAYTEDAPVWLSRAIHTSSFELSLDVRTAGQAQIGPARIFALSLNPYRVNLVVGQWGSTLSVRMRNPSTSLNGTPAYAVKNVFDDLDWHQIEIAITPEALKVRVDGKDSVAAPLPDRPLQRWDPDYRLALGNELSGDRPWLGSIRKAVVRVDDQSFDYLAPGALRYPEKLSVKSGRIITIVPFVDADFSRSILLDWAKNLLGFVPFGWLVVMARRPRPGFFLAIVFSAGISITIEVGQLLIFTSRVPSTEDFILNILGAALGAWLAGCYREELLE